MNECGGQGVYLPSTDCDDCGSLGQRIVALEDGKQDKLIPGANITIENNVISSTGGGSSYTPGTNIEIVGNEISAPGVYSKAEVNALISGLEHIRMEEVATLPATGESNVIYLVPRTGGGYEQWIYSGNTWIDLGEEDIDLSEYYTKTESNALLGNKQDVLTAGDNIDITGNTISATDTTTAFFAMCLTRGNDAAKVATVVGSTTFELLPGVIVGVRWTNTNTALNPTLNVNNTGAKEIYYRTGVINFHDLDKAGTVSQVHYYMYNGTHWWWMGQSYNDRDPWLYGLCQSASNVVDKTAYIADLKTDQIKIGTTIYVRFDYHNEAPNPTLNVNGSGASPIYMYGTTPVGVTGGESWEDGGIVSFTYEGTGWVMNDVGLTMKSTDYTTATMNRRVIQFNENTMITVMTLSATNVPVNIGWGSVYYSSEISLGNWPVAYNTAPMSVVTQLNGNDILGASHHGSTATSAGTVSVYRPVSGTAADVRLCIIAFGRWR